MPLLASLQCLPTELIEKLGHCLNDNDLAHLAQGNHFLNSIFSSSLIKRSLQEKPRIIMIPALTWAIDHKHQHLVERILANYYAVGRYPDALCQAAALGHCEIIQMLIGAGHDVNQSRASGERPLHASAASGHAAASQILLHAGADVKAINELGDTAFQLAVQSPHQILAAYKKIPVTLPLGEGQLIHGIQDRVIATLRVLLQFGTNQEVDEINRHGNTPLQEATEHCLGTDHGPDILRFLIEMGADPHAVGRGGETPIQIAASNWTSNLTALKFFLDIGISPNIVSPNGRSLLSEALECSSRTLKVLELLLARGAIPDVSVKLYYFFLLSEGSNPVLFETILILLLNHGADFRGDEAKCFTVAAHNGMLDIMKLLFELFRGLDINLPVRIFENPPSLTPIQSAISTENIDMLVFLIDNGVHMSAEEKNQVLEIFEKASPALGDALPVQGPVSV